MGNENILHLKTFLFTYNHAKASKSLMWEELYGQLDARVKDFINQPYQREIYIDIYDVMYLFIVSAFIEHLFKIKNFHKRYRDMRLCLLSNIFLSFFRGRK